MFGLIRSSSCVGLVCHLMILGPTVVKPLLSSRVLFQTQSQMEGDRSDGGAENVDWGDFATNSTTTTSPHDVFKEVFGTIATAGGGRQEEGPFDDLTSVRMAEMTVQPLDGYQVWKLMPWAGPPVQLEEGCGRRTVSFVMEDASEERVCVWDPKSDDDEFMTLAQLYKRAGGNVAGDYVLANANDSFVAWHTLVSSLLEPQCSLVVCSRLRYVQRRFVILNDNVATAYRTMNHGNLDKSLGEAWTLYLDGATQCSMPDELYNVALCGEVTRLIGPRFLHCSLLESGDAAGGIAMNRNPSLPGIALLHNILLIYVTDLSPFLHTVAKMTSLSDLNDKERSSLIYLEQRPMLSRTLLDVLCVPDAAMLRKRLDPVNFSLWCLYGMVANHASFVPNAVSLVLQDRSAVCTLHVRPEVAETAFVANETYCSAQGTEVPLVVNILWLMKEEMMRPVPVSVQERFLSLDVESIILDVLESSSQCNDRLCEVFTMDELQLASSHFLPILIRSGVGSSWLNKLHLLQVLFRQNASITHWEVLEALLPRCVCVCHC